MKTILAIDDSEQEVEPNIPEGYELVAIDPKDAQLPTKLEEAIGTACLILLDQKFNPDPQPLSLTASDGASFVAHLRSWSRLKDRGLPPLVLFTNEGDAFANEIPSVGAPVPLKGSFVGHEFQIAPALDVEWIQHKADASARHRILQLAEASIQVNEKIGSDGASLVELETLLDLPLERVWTDTAKEGLRASRPPVSQKGDKSIEPCGPSQVVRWLCHRALPFPGLLLSDLYAAWALGISLKTFKEMVTLPPETEWLRELEEAEYYGPLDNFVGRRWWKAGIDYLVWSFDQETEKITDRRQALRALAPGLPDEQLASSSEHVVVWTPDLREDKIAPIDDAAQLHPPGWPAEALDPWILKEELENDAVLQAMIEVADLP
jgi:hypothetical protein